MSNVSLAILDKLPVEIIQQFRKKGKSSAIPVHVQQYIIELDKVAEITNTEFEHNVSRVAKRLLDFFPDMSFATARMRVYDAINYFHLNSSVKAAAWDHYYADRMEDAAKYAMASDNIQEYRRCMQLARQFRNDAALNTIDPDEFKPHIILISPDVDAERLGLKDMNLKSLWNDTKEFINGLPVDSKNKEEALNDASSAIGKDAEDIDYENV